VQNICGYPEIEGDRLYATVDELKRMIDMAGKYGISIDCIAPPFLSSSFIDHEKHPAIMLAQSPERDRDIEQLQILIKNCAVAGIPSIKYNMSILWYSSHRAHTWARGCDEPRMESLRSSSRNTAHQGRARGC
jgi:mannonate dehydratase